MSPAQARARDFINFRKKIPCIARAARPRGFDSLPSLDPDPGRCPSRSRRDHRKSKFGLRQGIKLDLVYALTKSEF
jgi:hypothetical protein